MAYSVFCDGICKKLIIRHPHVFGDVNADTTEKVLKNWDAIKMKTKSQKTQTQAILSVSKALPSLMRSTKIQQKAAKVGFDALATAVEDVTKGTDSNVLIIDELPAKKLIEGKSNLKCAPLYYKGGEGENDSPATDKYAICVTKGQTELLKAINEVLAELGKEGIEALVQKHLGV